MGIGALRSNLVERSPAIFWRGMPVFLRVWRMAAFVLHVTRVGTEGIKAVAASIAERVQKRRESLRKAGLRPVQIWVPDARAPGFEAECRRQALLSNEADKADPDLMRFLEASFDDVEGWTGQDEAE